MKKALQALFIVLFYIIFIPNSVFGNWTVFVSKDSKEIIICLSRYDVCVGLKDGKGVFNKQAIFFTHERLVRETKKGEIKEKLYAPRHIPVDEDGLIMIPEIYLIFIDVIVKDGEIASYIFPLIFSGAVYKFYGFYMREATIFVTGNSPSFEFDELVLWTPEYYVITRAF